MPEACTTSSPARPTFCNIPDWGEYVLYGAGAVAIVIFAYGIWRHVRLWLVGQPAPQDGRTRERLGGVVYHVLGQARLLRVPYPGTFHVGMFWGFVILFIGTVLATIDWDITRLLLDTRLLEGRFYLGYELVLDSVGLLFIVALLMAMLRRYVLQPCHIVGQWDFMLWSLLIINVTGFLVEGLRLAFAPLGWGPWSWVGYLLAGGFQALGVSEGALRGWHLEAWLLHAGASLLFVAVLPYTNAVHMFTATLSTYFKPLDVPAGAALAPIDIEQSDFFGVSALNQFTWRQLLGVDTCTQCGRCMVACPAVMAGTPLNPKAIVVKLGQQLRQGLDTPVVVDAQAEVGLLNPHEVIAADELWACTTCMACVQECPVFIEILPDIVDLRRYLTLSEGAPPATAAQSLRNMVSAGNPWGYPAADRLKWAHGLDVPVAQPGEHYEVLYWVGCSGSYDNRNQRITRSVIRLLQVAGVRFAVMAEETCSGDHARRLGEEYAYQTLAGQNIASLNQYTFDRLIAHCPHCFNTIKNEYPQFGGSYEVLHHSQYISRLVSEGRLPGVSAEQRRITFHDTCFLGRYNGEYHAPRDVLHAAGLDITEMKRNRERGLCCGGGGGHMFFEMPKQKEINMIRLEEALELEPEVIGVACPFCLTMLESAATAKGVSHQVGVMDVAEILAAGLDSK